MRRNWNSYKWLSPLFTRAWWASSKRRRILCWSKLKLRIWESTTKVWTFALQNSSSRWSSSVWTTMDGSSYRLSKNYTTTGKGTTRSQSFMLQWWAAQQMITLMTCALSMTLKQDYPTTCLMFHSLTCRKWMGRPVSWLLQKVCSPWSSSRTSRTVRWRRKNHLRSKTITPSHHIKGPLRQRTWTRLSIQQKATSSPFSAKLLPSSVVVSRHLRS